MVGPHDLKYLFQPSLFCKRGLCSTEFFIFFTALTLCSLSVVSFFLMLYYSFQNLISVHLDFPLLDVLFFFNMIILPQHFVSQAASLLSRWKTFDLPLKFNLTFFSHLWFHLQSNTNIFTYLNPASAKILICIYCFLSYSNLLCLSLPANLAPFHCKLIESICKVKENSGERKVCCLLFLLAKLREFLGIVSRCLC